MRESSNNGEGVRLLLLAVRKDCTPTASLNIYRSSIDYLRGSIVNACKATHARHQGIAELDLQTVAQNKSTHLAQTAKGPHLALAAASTTHTLISAGIGSVIAWENLETA